MAEIHELSGEDELTMLGSGSGPYEAGSSFRPAFFFLKADQRRALSAFYGYARTVDDIADDLSAGAAEKETALAGWRARIEALFAGAAPAGPLEEDLSWAVRTFSLEKNNLLLLLEGVAMDARKNEYASFDELKYYMYRVASAVGLTCLEIFGWREPGARAYAENLGYAVQLTNILRDVREDAGMGRVYLPAEDLEKFGCDAAMLKNSISRDNFIELMKFEASRARLFYAAADGLVKGPERKKLLGAFIIGQLYCDLLDKMEAGGFACAGRRFGLNAFEKLRALYRAWKKTV